MFMLHITAMNANSQVGAAVLVTGTGKGIGEAVARRLAELGMLVFAGVRKQADAARWREQGGDLIHPVLLDVTDESSIDAALQQIRFSLGARTLTGLVNNAGIAVAGPLEFLPVAELRRQLEVNVIGQIAVTQAVLPLLRQSRGRIVNIGSISGRSALPLTGAYAASKFALEALTDSLRVELMPAGIHVSIIEPGVIATPIWDTSMKSAEELIKQMPEQGLEYYGRIIAAVRKRASGGTTRGLPPRAVADAVVHALTARTPRTRYLVGRDARARAWFQRLPDRLRDRIIARQLAKL
jgi:NAD(P)-dependent dehydrogenase (short-subunit alcohol dehydrogenase family)